MFFRNRAKRHRGVKGETKAELANSSVEDSASLGANPVEGTTPGLEEAGEETVVTAAAASARDTGTPGVDITDGTGTALATAGDADAIRLFPGFDSDEFEVGYRSDTGRPSLVLRWKQEGAEWVSIPSLFNRAVLAAIDERDSAADLNRLLRNYGYDVDAIAGK